MNVNFKSKAGLSSILSIIVVAAGIFWFLFDYELIGFLFLALSYILFLGYLNIAETILSMDNSDSSNKRSKPLFFKITLVFSSTSLLVMNLYLRKLIFQFTPLIIFSSVVLFIIFIFSFSSCRREFEKLKRSSDLSREKFEQIYFVILFSSFILGFSGPMFVSIFLLSYIYLSYFSFKKDMLISSHLLQLFLFICILVYQTSIFIFFPQILAVNEFLYLGDASFVLVLLASFLIFAACNIIFVVYHFYEENFHKSGQFSYKTLFIDILIIFLLTLFTFGISVLQIIALLFVPTNSVIFLSVFFTVSMSISFFLAMFIGRKIIRIRSDLLFLSFCAFSAVITAWLLIIFLFPLSARSYGYAFLIFYVFALVFMVKNRKWFNYEKEWEGERLKLDI